MRSYLVRCAAFATIALAGCLAYPGLTDNANGNSNGSSDTGNGVIPPPGGSPTNPGGGTGPNPPANGNSNSGSDPDDPELVGTIDTVICDRIIVVSVRNPGSGLQVFEATDDSADFANWVTDDEVGFDEDRAELTDARRDETAAADLLGRFEITTRFVQRTDTTLTAQLQDGSIWIFAGATFNEVRQWLTGNDLITVVRPPAGGKAGLLINHRRCTVTPVTGQ